MEALIDGAKAIVGMGGYNTFCEILSFDKRALLVPRIKPREEQLIRVRRAAELGIIDMLEPAAANDPAILREALKAVYARPRPSQSDRPLELNGLTTICDLVDGWLARDLQRATHRGRGIGCRAPRHVGQDRRSAQLLSAHVGNLRGPGATRPGTGRARHRDHLADDTGEPATPADQ